MTVWWCTSAWNCIVAMPSGSSCKFYMMQTVLLQTFGCSTGAIVVLSAYFAGTTLGIFTLDRVGLQILSQASDDAQERAHASTFTHPMPARGAVVGSCICEHCCKPRTACCRAHAAECCVSVQRPYCLSESGETGCSPRSLSAIPLPIVSLPTSKKLCLLDEL